MQRKSIDWFLYDRDFRYDRVKTVLKLTQFGIGQDTLKHFSVEEITIIVWRNQANIYLLKANNRNTREGVKYFQSQQ